MGGLPEGWREACLADLIAPDGIFCDGDWVESKDQDPDGDVRLVQLADIGDGKFRDRSNRSLNSDTAQRLRCTFLEPGDVLVARMPDPLGRACVYPGGSRKAATVVDVRILRPGRNGVNPKWLMWAINSPQVRTQIYRYQTGSTRKRISGNNLGQVRLLVPPLAEQFRIVELIEGQLSRLDAGSVLLEAARLRGAVLQKQLTKDVIGGRRRAAEEVGDVDDLLSLLDAQVAHMAGKKRWAQIRDPDAIWTHELPSGWRWRTLGSLCVDIQYGTSAKTALKESEDDVPVIRMGNIQDGRLDLTDLKYLPSEHVDIEKTSLRDGDLLFNRTNSAELVGKSAVYSERMGAAVYASYLIRCRFAEGIEPDWVNAVVNSNFGRRYIASVVTQQVGQANVNSAKMALMPIPVPPQSEQHTALKVLRDWEAALARPQLAARVAMKRSKGLRSAILRSAFSGNLAPQDPSDEPADTLLARIAAEREAAKPARGTKRAATRPRKKASAPPSEPAPAPTSAPSNAVQQEFDL
ncbi:restriction endonuclease subunit S [[Kitasatospora] papulosa]|uniref:restriction endonuclease subunit S n=1 Tax=[Kitasatospora] papulosa TaxID=1464011 RepID=UPI0036CA80A2